ncbi:hypothetical protein JVT61DRAFT_15158 [Boletus reticuloceps]|uniref:Protein kinase domain-containing protein n=1 Tax=Boletus reticuloceps TaxID=495285 RepID=A0A8I2YVB9_9AGAM|nr:hypothetical protein JVT61DRAFT_15158 [Boletus reticuloceps]
MEAIIAGDYRFEPEEYWCNLSETARKFVATCLTVDPEARPTAEQMLRHSWLTAEVPHFVDSANGEPADLLPHVRKAFNARRTRMFRFCFIQPKCILIAPIRAVRKAVFSMMAMKRMLMLAHHLTPEQHQLNEDMYQFKQESEKENLEHADVLHHHNSEMYDGTASRVFEGLEHTEESRVEEKESISQGPAATGSGPSSDQAPSITPAETVKDNKEVTEKLATVSLAASAKKANVKPASLRSGLTRSALNQACSTCSRTSRIILQAFDNIAPGSVIWRRVSKPKGYADTSTVFGRWRGTRGHWDHAESEHAFPVQAGREYELCNGAWETERDAFGGGSSSMGPRRSYTVSFGNSCGSPLLLIHVETSVLTLRARSNITKTLMGLSGPRRPITDQEMLKWANSTVQKAKPSTRPIRSFKDPSITTGIFILGLLEALRPGIIDPALVINVHEHGDFAA